MEYNSSLSDEWIFGWNNAMKDVIRYVKSSSYYPNQDDIIKHCMESMITFPDKED